MAALLSLVIRLYQRILRPVMPPLCRFWPTCSDYALEAVRVHGAAHGSLLAVKRICRCHPFNPGGIDPVPPKTPKTSKIETHSTATAATTTTTETT